MHKTTAAKVLGFYLFICATLEAGFFVLRSAFESHDDLGDFFFFTNPRPMLDPELLRDGGRVYLISVVWLFIIAVTILAKPASKVPIRFYVVLETLMALPTIGFMLLGYLLSGGIWERHPLHVDAKLGMEIAIFLPFTLVPYLLAISLLDTVRLLIRLAATLVLSASLWILLGSATRSTVVAGVCALICLVSGVIWSVIPGKRTAEIRPSEANSIRL